MISRRETTYRLIQHEEMNHLFMIPQIYLFKSHLSNETGHTQENITMHLCWIVDIDKLMEKEED